jgi:hypothetical protein
MNMNKHFQIFGVVCSLLLLGFGCQKSPINNSDETTKIKNDIVLESSSTSPIIEPKQEIQDTETEFDTSTPTKNLNISNTPTVSKQENTLLQKKSENIAPPSINTSEAQVEIVIPSAQVDTKIISNPITVSQPVIQNEQPKILDLCRNIPKNQTEVPRGMYKSVDGDCFDVPVPKVEQAPLKPTITGLTSSPDKGRPGQTIQVSYKAENATVCAFVNNPNIEIPFVGNLPEATRNIELQQNDFKDNKFTFYLICADKDWNTVKKTIVIDYDPVFDTVQQTSFFSANGGNIGGGGTGNIDGVPFVAISPLKNGATAVVVMNGKSYPLDSDGIHFFFNDLSFDPTWIYAGSCTPYSYTINFSYQDESNSNITGSSSGGFCLNNLNQP